MNVLKLMKKERLSRVPIIRQDGKIVKIISQSDVIHLLASYASECDPDKLFSQVAELNLGLKHMIHVSSSTPAIEALQLMAEHKLSSIPICDSCGALVTTISDNDIRMASAGYFEESKLDSDDGDDGLSNLFSLFSLPVIDLVHAIRSGPASRDRKTAKFFPTAVRIFPTDKLSKVIEKIASTGLHRLYITESATDFTLRGVISLVDIIELLF